MKSKRTGSPDWKLYDATGSYQASSHQPELLAACIGLLREGATIRFRHMFTCWTEGVDGIGFESYDAVAEKCYAEVQARTDSRGVVHRTIEKKDRQNAYTEKIAREVRADKEKREAALRQKGLDVSEPTPEVDEATGTSEVILP